MLKKFLAVFAILFVFTAVWAEKISLQKQSTADFPYVYTTSYGQSNNDYRRCINGQKINSDFEGDNYTGSYYQNSPIHCFVLSYKKDKEKIETDSKNFLTNYRTVFKNFDEEIDKDNQRNWTLYIIFTDLENNVVASARYDEDVDSTKNSVLNPFNGVKKSVKKAYDATKKE